MEHEGAEAWVPVTRSVAKLASAAEECRGCELWEDATQVVFSRGRASARLALVGEQPGDQEDRAGEPFVGPAGRVLADALEAAKIDPSRVYLTNAVKHFRHTVRGKRRIHEKPAVGHVTACHPWLEAELSVVRPHVVVCLGATAGRPDERLTGPVLLVARLLADEGDPSRRPTPREHHLRGVLPQLAATAALGRLRQLRHAPGRRHPCLGAFVLHARDVPATSRA